MLGCHGLFPQCRWQGGHAVLHAVQRPCASTTKTMRSSCALRHPACAPIQDTALCGAGRTANQALSFLSYNLPKIESIFNPVRGLRDAQVRAGIKPVNHARANARAIKEQSQMNALRKASDTNCGSGAVTKLPPGGSRGKDASCDPAYMVLQVCMHVHEHVCVGTACD